MASKDPGTTEGFSEEASLKSFIFKGSLLENGKDCLPLLHFTSYPYLHCAHIKIMNNIALVLLTLIAESVHVSID